MIENDIGRQIISKANEIELLTHDIEKAQRELSQLEEIQETMPVSDGVSHGIRRNTNLDEQVLEKIASRCSHPRLSWVNSSDHIQHGEIVYKIHHDGWTGNQRIQTVESIWYHRNGLYCSSVGEDYIYFSRI